MVRIVEGYLPQSNDKSFLFRKFGKTFVLSFELPRPVLSWAAFHGGFRPQVSHIIIHALDSVPPQSARQATSRLGLRGTVVGMMTQTELSVHTVTVAKDELQVSAIAMVDHSLPAAVGGFLFPPVETTESNIYPTAFNLILVTNYLFTHEAMLEAISIATEAKTRAICESGLYTTNGELATGGTADSIAIASGHDRRYKSCSHQDTWGFLVGRAALESMRRAMQS